jgi:hypothetical protein
MKKKIRQPFEIFGSYCYDISDKNDTKHSKLERYFKSLAKAPNALCHAGTHPNQLVTPCKANTPRAK